MSDSEQQQQRNTSRRCNEDVLLDIGFRKVGNSSLYKKGTHAYILSPGISQGKHERYWFDLRQANVKRLGASTKAWVLLRIVPSWFAFFTINSIRKHMNRKTQEWRSNSGLVYGFYCKLDERNRLIKITPKKDNSSALSTALLDRAEVTAQVASAFNIE